MGVVIIGDRQVGKTTLVLELARERNTAVRVIQPDFAILKRQLMEGTEAIPTASREDKTIIAQVELPSGTQQFSASWIDTPGEAWKVGTNWREENPEQWRSLEEDLNSAEGVMLILAPHRDGLIHSRLTQEKLTLDDSRFRTSGQWRTRFQHWVTLLDTYCREINHLLICLNMADLFCQNAEAEIDSLERKGWYPRSEYVRNRYFSEVSDCIVELNNRRARPAQFFITSSRYRYLLELPWLYLGTYLSQTVRI